MYNVVLAAMLLSGGEATSWHRSAGSGCYSCSGCYGCYGGCSGAYRGGHGGHGHRACYGSYCSGSYCSGYSGSYCSGCYGNWGYSYYSSCSGCWGCYGSYGCTGSFCSGAGIVVAMPGCYGGYGCSGCYGGVIGAPPVMAGGSISPEALPVTPKVTMPGADDRAAPQTEAERDAVRKLLQKMRDKKQGGLPSPEEAASAPKVAARARLTVKLPAEARLWVDQIECPLSSSERSFQTPTLQPGQTYYYTLKVEVRRDGAPVTDSQRVLVRAGAHVTVNFANVAAIATAQR